MTPALFTQSLAETVAWVTPRLDPADPRWSMRSAELRPPADYDPPDNPGFFNESPYIAHVVTTRSRLTPKPVVGIPPSGRLLLVDYELTNHNGATEDETKGFFDWADNPPWDLWVGELDEQLIAWIPECFVETVERAILYECMGMLEWVGDEDAETIHPDWLRL